MFSLVLPAVLAGLETAVDDNVNQGSLRAVAWALALAVALAAGAALTWRLGSRYRAGQRRRDQHEVLVVNRLAVLEAKIDELTGAPDQLGAVEDHVIGELRQLRALLSSDAAPGGSVGARRDRPPRLRPPLPHPPEGASSPGGAVPMPLRSRPSEDATLSVSLSPSRLQPAEEVAQR